MSTFITFLVLGLGLGSIYALCAQGIVLIYRGSQVVNFSQGAMALVGASIYADAAQSMPRGVAVVVGLAVCAVLGLVLHLIMSSLKNASELARVVATLGAMTVLQGAISLHYGSQLRFVEGVLPTGTWDLGSIHIPWDRTWLIVIACALTLVLWLVYNRTHFGLRTAAVSENRRTLAALGWNPGMISAINWMIGSILAGGAGILVAPIVGLEPAALTLLIIPALAAGVFGSFKSFPIALLGGLGVGALQSEATKYIHFAGVSSAIPFLAVLIVVVLKTDVLGGRFAGARKLPRLGSGQLRPIGLAIGVGLGIGSLWLFTSNWTAAVSLTMASALIALSLVVLTGYTRQISLGQYGVAGLGAWIATRLADVYGLPFPLVLLIAIVAVVPAGMIFALPALRARGVTLAVVTLGLGIALQSLIFNNPDLTGGPVKGTVVSSPTLFGWSISPIAHPQRYASFTILAFVVVGLVVRNVRRSGSGRRLLAVRTNERAAASLGISVTGAKLYAFALATAIATVGGVVLAFRNTQITFDDYSPLNSILLLLSTFVGGIGYIVGAILGATFIVGSVVYEILEHFFSVSSWVSLVGGILVILTVISEPDGVVGQFARLRAKLTGLVTARTRRETDPAPGVARADATPGDRADRASLLDVRSLSVRFGGVAALTDVDVAVRSGEVVGLIGPNGAGKSTFVDAVVGLNRNYKGTVSLDDHGINREPSYQRARHGVSRSFQSLELFEDLTVLENILTACDERHVSRYLVDLIRPAKPRLTSAASAAIEEFGLADVLDKRPEELSYGTRRLVAVARAFATSPRILLLDEPAAGLDESQSRHLGNLIRRMADDWRIGVLLIEHDVPLVMSVCDRISVLNFGRCIASGTPEQIRTDPKVISAYLGERTGGAPRQSPIDMAQTAVDSIAATHGATS